MVILVDARSAAHGALDRLREGSYALGATKWQTIWHQVLPMAMPGILTGLILALSRAIGETAPLITIGALTYIPFAPDSIWSPFTVLPIQIFNWVSRPQVGFHANAAAGILVLVALLLAMNAVAIWLAGSPAAAGPLMSTASRPLTSLGRAVQSTRSNRPSPIAPSRSTSTASTSTTARSGRCTDISIQHSSRTS